MEKQQQAWARERKAMVGSGDRSEKIRTYNFPQNRLTDHRIGFTVHQVESVMDGKLQPLVDALITHYQAEKLKRETDSVAQVSPLLPILDLGGGVLPEPPRRVASVVK